jgi:hypothetical protein
VASDRGGIERVAQAQERATHIAGLGFRSSLSTLRALCCGNVFSTYSIELLESFCGRARSWNTKSATVGVVKKLRKRVEEQEKEAVAAK